MEIDTELNALLRYVMLNIAKLTKENGFFTKKHEVKKFQDGTMIIGTESTKEYGLIVAKDGVQNVKNFRVLVNVQYEEAENKPCEN